LTLKRLIIAEDEPSTLLKDFETYLQGLTQSQFVLAPRSEYLPPELLYHLNQKMVYPVSGATLSTPQRSYRMLHLFYHLALAGKLFEKSLAGEKGEMYLQATERLPLYQDLKPAEKYFFLLETFWTDVDWNKLNYHLSCDLEDAPLAMKLISEMHPEKEINLMEEKRKNTKLIRALESFSDLLLYLSYFGFLEMIPPQEVAKRQASKQDFLVKSVKASLFGVTIAPILQQCRELIYWNLPWRRAAGDLKPKPGFPLSRDNQYRIYRQEMVKISGKPKRQASMKGVKVKRGSPGAPSFCPSSRSSQKGNWKGLFHVHCQDSWTEPMFSKSR
jgi:hypothetical protein